MLHLTVASATRHALANHCRLSAGVLPIWSRYGTQDAMFKCEIVGSAAASWRAASAGAAM